jgi:hypothetical protein
MPASFNKCETQLLLENVPSAIRDVPLGVRQMLKLP